MASRESRGAGTFHEATPSNPAFDRIYISNQKYRRVSRGIDLAPDFISHANLTRRMQSIVGERESHAQTNNQPERDHLGPHSAAFVCHVIAERISARL